MIRGEDIYSVRKRLGLSQEKLAEALGVSRNTISRWERGEFKPTGDKIAALEQLLAQLEDGAAASEATPAPEDIPTLKEAAVPQPAVPAKAKRWPMAVLCAGILCALLIGIAALIGVYSINRQLNPGNVIPAEEIEREEVDLSQIDEPATIQPLRP